jgi:hypothetical protein
MSDPYAMKSVEELWTGNGPLSVGRELRFARRRVLPYRVDRQRVLDQAVRNVEARRCMGWARPPTFIGDDLAAAYRAEFARLWAER